VKFIAWNFNGSNFVSKDDKKEDLKRLGFQNGDIIPDVESYFADDEESDEDEEIDEDD
jgi:hypothetical protein